MNVLALWIWLLKYLWKIAVFIEVSKIQTLAKEPWKLKSKISHNSINNWVLLFHTIFQHSSHMYLILLTVEKYIQPIKPKEIHAAAKTPEGSAFTIVQQSQHFNKDGHWENWIVSSCLKQPVSLLWPRVSVSKRGRESVMNQQKKRKVEEGETNW